MSKKIMCGCGHKEKKHDVYTIANHDETSTYTFCEDCFGTISFGLVPASGGLSSLRFLDATTEERYGVK